jgi:hypothetical protein
MALATSFIFAYNKESLLGRVEKGGEMQAVLAGSQALSAAAEMERKLC